MNKRLLVTLMVVGLLLWIVITAYAQQTQDSVYLPLIIREPTITLTPTATLTSTPRPTATPTLPPTAVPVLLDGDYYGSITGGNVTFTISNNGQTASNASYLFRFSNCLGYSYTINESTQRNSSGTYHFTVVDVPTRSILVSVGISPLSDISTAVRISDYRYPWYGCDYAYSTAYRK